MPVKWPHWVILIPILVGVFHYLYPKIENLFLFFPQKKFDFLPATSGLEIARLETKKISK